MTRDYCVIGIDKSTYYAHRLAWLYVHGAFPPDQIDHINGDPADNRIENLRACSRSQNIWNRRSRSATGFKGVSGRPGTSRKYAAIHAHGKRFHLGAYGTAEEAARAYDTAARRYHGAFANTNSPSREGK